MNRANIQNGNRYYGNYHRGYYRNGHHGYYRNGGYGYYGGWPYYSGYSPYYSGYSPYYSGYSPYSYSSGYLPYDDGYYGNTYPYADSYYGPATMQVGYVRVLLPDPNAQVWINGQPMTQSGMDETFTTPLLSTPVTYDIRAEWTSYGQAMSNERTVTVSPGATTVVDFTAGVGQ